MRAGRPLSYIMRVGQENLMFRSLLSILSVATLVAAAPKQDWTSVADALGRAGTLQPDGVYKVSFPRSDLVVTADGVSIRPALALGSWIAFNQSGGHAMAMGDLVLLESEVDVVIGELQKGRIEQTALHNHLMGESPRVMYLHFSGHGDAAALARTLHDALATTKTPMGPPPAPTAALIDLPLSDLDRIIGRGGKANGVVYQFAVPRAEKIMEHGMEIPASMGLATAINFQPTGNGRAAITGDFVLLGAEVNPVIRALRSGGIAVTALHSHMLEEQPRLFFMHFWANDDAIKLAKGLRAALDQTNSAKEKGLN